MTEDLIIAKADISVGGRKHHPADRFDYETHLAAGHVDDRVLRLMKEQRTIVPLTRANFARCLAQRPGGIKPPAGFTNAYLIEKGIIDAPLEKPEPAAMARNVVDAIEHLEHTAETKQVGDYFVTPHKKGIGNVFSVTNAKGELMRATAFRKQEAAVEFIATLGAPESTGGESSDNAVEEPAAEDEIDDDSDLQSQPGGQHQQGEAAAGRHGSAEG